MTTATSWSWQLITTGTTFAYMLIIAAAVLLCGIYVRLSPHMNVLLVGFLGILAVSFSRVAFMWFGMAGGIPPSMFFALASLASLVAWSVVVCGLALLFRDLQRKLDGTAPTIIEHFAEVPSSTRPSK